MPQVPSGRRVQQPNRSSGPPRAQHDGFAGSGAEQLQYSLDAIERGIDRPRSFHPPTVTKVAALEWCVSCGTPETMCTCGGRAYSSTSLRMADLVNASGGGLAQRRASGSFAFKGERE